MCRLNGACTQASQLGALLPLVRLLVRERESARPLIRARLAADTPIGTSKQNAPQSDGAEEAAADSTEREARHTGFGPESVAVEGGGGVEEGGYGQRGEGVGCLGVCGRCGCSCNA